MQVEAELQELEEAEAKEYLEGLGVKEGGLRSLIAATYKQLGLLTYFTTGGLPVILHAAQDADQMACLSPQSSYVLAQQFG